METHLDWCEAAARGVAARGSEGKVRPMAEPRPNAKSEAAREDRQKRAQSLQNVVAAQGQQILFDMRIIHETALLRYARLSDSEEAEALLKKKDCTPQSYYKQLKGDEAQMMARAAWMHSPFFTDEDRRLIGRKEKYQLQKGKSLTRRSLGVLLKRYRDKPLKNCKRVDHYAEKNTIEGCVRVAQRFCNAAIVHGLMQSEPGKVQKINNKPLVVTKNLDLAMRANAVGTAKLIARLLDEVEYDYLNGKDE